MSEVLERKVSLSEVSNFVKQGGDFQAEQRYAPDPEAEFKPWGKSSFKPIESFTPKTAPKPAQVEEPTEDDSHESAQSDAAQAAQGETHSDAQTREAEHAALPPAPPPPPPEVEEQISPAEVIAALEKAKEDGRALGYQQGLEAARREFGDAKLVLQNIANEFTMQASDALERNADILAHHVRRIAQDLFGAVFAESPQAFVERIKASAEMFTKASSNFILFLNPQDMRVLEMALKSERIMANIEIVEDETLPLGAYRLESRDLEFEDLPRLADRGVKHA